MQTPDSMSTSTEASMTNATKAPITSEVEISFTGPSEKGQIQQILSKFRPRSARTAKNDMKAVRKLHDSIDCCDYRACYKALTDGVSPNAVLASSGSTPLQRALDKAAECALSHDRRVAGEANRIVSALVLAGASLDVRDADGRTPLIQVAKGEMAHALASLMLDFGANVYEVDNELNSALHYAAMSTPLPEMKNTEMIRILVTNGADHGIKNVRGRTPLFKAVLFEQLDRAKELLDHGADMCTTDKQGRTPLHIAVIQGHVKMTELLCSQGAFVDIRDANGQTPLHHAISHGNQEIAEVLLLAGADPNLVSKGETPLCRATSKCNMEMVDVLLRHGADYAAPSPNYGGALPIHLAAIGPSLEMLDHLLQHAASLCTSQDDLGRTPLDWAREAGKDGHAQLLEARAC